MSGRLSSIALAAAVTCAANVAEAQPRADVNFAFGGATTHSGNAIEAFAAQDPTLAQLIAGIRAGGLDVIGVTQQLEFATSTLNDVDSEHDLFWVYAGTNNFLEADWVTFLLSGGTAPLPLDPAQGPAELAAAMETLYMESGARRFVVPNLPSMGDLPLYGANGPFGPFGTALTDLLDSLTQAHNAALAGALAGFQAAHPDVSVTTVDVYSIFKGVAASGAFPVTDLGCDTFYNVVLNDPAALNFYYDPSNGPEFTGGPCAGFMYLDIVHPSSLVWAPVAQAIADGLAGEDDVDRIITIGDSFSDIGSESDTFVRTLGFPFPPAPFTAGRFTEGSNVVQQVEALVAVETASAPFAQPLRSSETFTQKGNAATTGSVYVPKKLSGSAAPFLNTVTLVFETNSGQGWFPNKTLCFYNHDGDQSFDLTWCSDGVEGGDLIETASTKVKFFKWFVDEVTIDWLHY